MVLKTPSKVINNAFLSSKLHDKHYILGDHYVHIKIDVPKELDYKHKAILQAYAEMESNTPGTVKGFTYKKDGSRAVMEDQDGLVADIKEVFEEVDQIKPKNGQD